MHSCCLVWLFETFVQDGFQLIRFSSKIFENWLSFCRSGHVQSSRRVVEYLNEVPYCGHRFVSDPPLHLRMPGAKKLEKGRRRRCRRQETRQRVPHLPLLKGRPVPHTRPVVPLPTQGWVTTRRQVHKSVDLGTIEIHGLCRTTSNSTIVRQPATSQGLGPLRNTASAAPPPTPRRPLALARRAPFSTPCPDLPAPSGQRERRGQGSSRACSTHT